MPCDSCPVPIIQSSLEPVSCLRPAVLRSDHLDADLTRGPLLLQRDLQAARTHLLDCPMSHGCFDSERENIAERFVIRSLSGEP